MHGESVPFRGALVNILCLDQYAEIGGAQRMLLELLPSFTARGWNPYVAAPNDNGSLLDTVRELGYGTGSFDLGSYTKVRKTRAEMVHYLRDSYRLAKEFLGWIRSLAIDVVYVNGPRVLPAASLAARRSSLPLVFHCHNRLQQRSAVCLAATSLRLASAQVVACCRFATEPLLSYIGSQFVHVVYNGVAGLSAAPRENNPRIKRIGVVGRIEEEKGQLDFVRAARILASEHPDLRFSVIGKPLFADGTYSDRVRMASEGLPIEFPGWMNRTADIFASLDLIVVPSTSLDATPRIILEALAAGVPVVAYAVGGIPELLRNMETGILVEVRTPEALARGIELALRMSPEKIRDLVQKGRRTWEEKHSPEAYGDKICHLISGMVAAA
jgi:glycosyltransferase involved in cell wall biosynthesis